MAIQIHIRVRESDWNSEEQLANYIAGRLEEIIPPDTYIPILVLPVEDPENEMDSLDSDSESRYLESKYKADKAERTEW